MHRLLFLATACGALTSAACYQGGDSAEAEAEPAPLVEVVPARSGTLPLSERLSGVVEARNQVAVRSEIEARVVEVLVRNGDSVTEGQALVRLDDRDLRERLRQAEASVRVAEATARSARARVAELDARITRSRKLAAQDLIADVDLETLEARVDAAQAEAEEEIARVEESKSLAEEQRTALTRATVRSPVAGKVGRRDVEVGMLVDPSRELFRVGGTENVIVEVSLTEDMLGYLEEGQPVRIFPGREATSNEASSAPIEAELSRISPFLSEDSFSTVAEIEVGNASGRLRPGMFVTVDVLYGQTEQATLVPSSALWEDPQNGERRIFVVVGEPSASEDEAQQVEMREGVEVLAVGRGTVGLRGVEPGERVVTIGQHLISQDEDAVVRVREADWQDVQDLQSLQREDLLAGHMAKQRRLAEEMGAEPPSNEDYMRLGSERSEQQGKGEG